MHFLVIAKDGTDDGALDRRMAARPAHIEAIEQMRQRGEVLFGAALLDDQDKMVGSVLICDFPSRAELDGWLKVEPYVTGKVWHKIDVTTCAPGASFVPAKAGT